MTTSLLPMQSKRCNALSGTLHIPGDKSISHRVLIIASQSVGSTKIHNFLEGEDTLNTAKALRLLGVKIDCIAPRHWHLHGVGVGGLHEADNVLDMGNSGTGARLMMGLLASYPFATFITGDESLRRRPMKRVMTPLIQMGVRFEVREENKLPLAMHGSSHLLPIEYTLPVPSAQVKSAILLAALNTRGKTTVIEKERTRDHSERMLRHFGWEVEVTELKEGGTAVSLLGQQIIPPRDHSIIIPGDPSSAAFPAVAALLVPQSEIVLRNICVNPLRTGLYTTLQEMGASISFSNCHISAGEEVADICVKYSQLKGVKVPANRAPSMIDEYPILAIAASFAEGRTIMEGLGELRVKESDRLAAIINGLHQCGVSATMEGDTLTIQGSPEPEGGGTIVTHQDHRIAMSFLVMGMATKHAIKIDDGSFISTSFPGFTELMNQAGGKIIVNPTPSFYIHPSRPLIIAIDGPAASGKGTLARRVAEQLAIPYLDTGSIYRAVGLKLIYSGKNPYDKRAAMEAARALNEQDLANPRLRQERVGQAASIISANPEVRKILLDFQHRFAYGGKGAVLDGRDIGTVVCPHADIKIFITANLETRAQRRHRELQGEGIEVVYSSVLEDLRERDERDAQRAIAPLIPAEDAVVIDTSCLDAETVFIQTMDVINKKMKI